MSSVSPGHFLSLGNIIGPRHQILINGINANTTPTANNRIRSTQQHQPNTPTRVKSKKKGFVVPQFSLLLTTNIPADVKDNRKKLVDAIHAQLPDSCSVKEIRKTRKGDVAITASSERDFNKLLGTDNWKKTPFVITPRLDIINDASTAYIKPFLEGDDLEDFETVLNNLGISFSALSQVKVAGKAIGTLRVQIHKRSDLETLVKNKIVVNYLGRIVEPHAENSVVQCFNCQVYGHIQTDCQEEQRCLRCGESGHGHKTCPKPKEEEKCSNCQEAHIASFKGCKIRLSYVRKLRRNTNNDFVNGQPSGPNRQSGPQDRQIFTQAPPAPPPHPLPPHTSQFHPSTYSSAAQVSRQESSASAPVFRTFSSNASSTAAATAAAASTSLSSSSTNFVAEDHLEAYFASFEDKLRQNTSEAFDITLRAILEAVVGSNPGIVIQQEVVADSVIRQVSKRPDLFDIGSLARNLYGGHLSTLFQSGCQQQFPTENSTGTASAPFKLSSANGAIRKGPVMNLEDSIRPLQRGPFIDPTYPQTMNAVFKHHATVDSPRKRKKMHQQQQKSAASVEASAIVSASKSPVQNASAAAPTAVPTTAADLTGNASSSTEMQPMDHQQSAPIQTPAHASVQTPNLPPVTSAINASSTPTPATTSSSTTSTAAAAAPIPAAAASIPSRVETEPTGSKLLTPSKHRMEKNIKNVVKTTISTSTSISLPATSSSTTSSIASSAAVTTVAASLPTNPIPSLMDGQTNSTGGALPPPTSLRQPNFTAPLAMVNIDAMTGTPTTFHDFRSNAPNPFGIVSSGWASGSLGPISGSPTIQAVDLTAPIHPCLLYGDQQFHRAQTQDHLRQINNGTSA